MYIYCGQGYKWLNQTPVYKFNDFHFFNLNEKFVKNNVQSLF